MVIHERHELYSIGRMEWLAASRRRLARIDGVDCHLHADLHRAGGSTAKSVTVTVAGPARLTLTWVDNAAGNAIFKIERRIAAGGTYAQIATTSAGATQYVDATPARGNTYCYRVRAWTAGGNSQYSNEACATL